MATEQALTSATVLDVSGFSCPMPLLKAKKAMYHMEKGQVIQIISTDPSSVLDFATFAKQTENAILKTEKKGGKYLIWMQKV